MQAETVAAVAFAVGTAGNSFKAVPQFVRTALRGKTSGLSTTAVWVACTAQVLWLSFGIAIQDWRFVALGAVQAALTGATLLRFVLKTGWYQNRIHATVGLPAWAMFAVAASTNSSLVLEALGAGLGIFVGAPQLLYLWKRRREPTDVSGISPVEYVVVITAQAAWVIYWIIEGHPVAAVGAGWGGAARALTFALLHSQQRQHALNYGL